MATAATDGVSTRSEVSTSALIDDSNAALERVLDIDEARSFAVLAPDAAIEITTLKLTFHVTDKRKRRRRPPLSALAVTLKLFILASSIPRELARVLLRTVDWSSVGASLAIKSRDTSIETASPEVGAIEGLAVGTGYGDSDGAEDGKADGSSVGGRLGKNVGREVIEGLAVGAGNGWSDGAEVGNVDGSNVGRILGIAVGTADMVGMVVIDGKSVGLIVEVDTYMSSIAMSPV
jgi:hypothetical protein